MCCDACDFIHYANPRVLVSALLTYENRLLWMRRGTEPKKGCWAQPGGFMEQQERPEDAAARELFEETGVVFDPDELELFAIGSLPEISEVYIVFRGSLAELPQLFKSPEATELGFFSRLEAPWAQQAYPEVQDVLRLFYDEHERGQYGVYCGSYAGGVNRYRPMSLVS